MSANRVDIVEQALDSLLDTLEPAPRRLAPDAPVVDGSSLTAGTATRLFSDMVRSRAVDVAARRLKADGLGYYTISSAGHEMNTVLGAQLRPTDPCLLHYRSGGLMMARGRAVGRRDPVRDTLLGVVAAAEDPVSQGRHKVWGSREAWVPPQTSTIASHLPKATGLAFSISRAHELGVRDVLPEDAVVACSFGDASANHATALTGINAARWARRLGEPVPVLFVCEDNGVGISVPTPRRWIAESFGSLRHLRYLRATGEVDEVWGAVAEAIRTCREERAPVFLHLDTVRLWGHAGSDVEQAYRSMDDIRAAEAGDPLLATARRLVELGAATPRELRDLVAEVRAHVAAVADEVAGGATLADRATVVAPLAPHRPAEVRRSATRTIDPDLRAAVHPRGLPEDETAEQRRTLAAQLNAGLRDVMAAHPRAVVFGEDVARKGGVYGVTAGLQSTFGGERVFDTLLDETTILGVAQGAGMAGLLPLPEIQYLAYLHNALDQLRGEAASTRFFSNGQFSTPMVVRVASFAYQKGFGGHFHNDDAIGALRDIPGLVLAAPSRGDDAVRMLRACVGMAEADGAVSCFLEPIALYHERDLFTEGDGRWLTTYPAPDEVVLPGEARTYGPGEAALTIVTYGNGVRMSLRAALRLADAGVPARVLDLRWLAPLPLDAVTAEAELTGRVLVADECRATGGGIADAVIAHLAESGSGARLASVRSADCYVPLGPAADLVLLQEDEIVKAGQELAARP
jgi:2-oxoisovalerate dehydrogenase E1 component